ncbi:ATP-binding cassette domain-containing protein [Paracoccus thiocyanatus]|uniref:Nickel import system ATP-binding protein NikD n=1 Tax=Paracoccus thiocyanatus TaxID=34006 RepID=A0A3D8PC33_9RHOB|nr:ATP-binding cassette domain-containing protein [Paracoccus thiocyanatus]RDW12878.1 ABC transporter ATP-binding protein [Paracoccus thiocyanatus]
MTQVLEIRGLSLRFPCGGMPLADVSLTARPGQILAIVGASGAGKSLLARAVLHLLPPNARMTGEIRLDGAPLDPAAAAALRGRVLALVPQSTTFLDPLAKVGQQLRWAARRAGAPQPFAVDQALARVGLPPQVAKLYPGAISAGMARRVLLAAALAGDPAVVIADEPTDGLDPDNLRLVLRRLRALADAGRTVIVITHDLITALPYADRVAVMRDGSILAEERAAAFCGDGAALISGWSRRLWNALPQNAFDAADGSVHA